MPKINRVLAIKTLVAIVLLSALVAVAGRQLAPTVPSSHILFMAALGAAALLSGLVVLTVISMTFRQFMLRMGATDTQWFWFKSEPPGLVQLREDARAAKAAQTSKIGQPHST